MPALRRNPKDQVESQTLKEEAVMLKLPWRLKDVKDARAMGYMLISCLYSENPGHFFEKTSRGLPKHFLLWKPLESYIPASPPDVTS